MNDPYWERITTRASAQRFKGLSEYGMGIEDNNQSIFTRLDYLQEELIDSLYYIEWLRDKLNEKKR